MGRAGSNASGSAASRSAAPGWYTSPGEDGLARFWDGRRWTEGRQPLPPPADAEPVLPMTEPIASVGGNPGVTGYPGVTGPRDTPVAAGSDGRTFRLRLRGGEVLDVGAITDSRAARVVSRASTLGGALFMLMFAAIWLTICFALMKPAIWDAARPAAGEATAPGVVVDQHSYIDDEGDRLCAPEATFTVDGVEYVAASSTSSNDCPSRGSDVTVIYTVADPVDSHVAPSSTMQLLFLVFPVAGFIVLAIGLVMLVNGLGGNALVTRLRARRRADEAGIPAPTSPPVTWNP